MPAGPPAHCLGGYLPHPAPLNPPRPLGAHAGVVAAARKLNVTVPIVLRLEGTNVDLGKKILSESELNLIAADDMKDGARKIVELAR